VKASSLKPRASFISRSVCSCFFTQAIPPFREQASLTDSIVNKAIISDKSRGINPGSRDHLGSRNRARRMIRRVWSLQQEQVMKKKIPSVGKRDATFLLHFGRRGVSLADSHAACTGIKARLKRYRLEHSRMLRRPLEGFNRAIESYAGVLWSLETRYYINRTLWRESSRRT